MLKPLVTTLLLALPLAAQQQPAPPAQPQVRVNVINVCTPSAEDQKDIAAALALVPQKAAFAPDFEVDRGRTQVPDGPLSSFVRVRRDLASGAIATVQYSFSFDETGIIETLAFRVRDPKDYLQIIFDNRITAASTTPAQVLATDTPVSHMKIERFGKSSIGLARCETDQSAYEPLFRSASGLMARYRTLLGVRRTVPVDLRLMGVGQPAPSKSGKKPSPKPVEKKPPEKPAH